MARQRKKLKINKDKIKKTSAVEATIDTSQNINFGRPLSPVVNYPNIGPKSGNGANVDFTKYYGKGYDDITNRVYYTAKALLKNTDAFSERTQRTYIDSGFKTFAEYLEIYCHGIGKSLVQEDITPVLIENYLMHLQASELSFTTQKNRYTFLKSLLHRMKEKGYWTSAASEKLNDSFFPSNPFPYSNKQKKGEKALSQHEKTQLIVALKQAIKPIYNKTEVLSGYELTLCLLAVAVQTGINTSPLLNMTIGALSDHPLKGNRKLLTVFKNRGHANQLHNLHRSQDLEVVQGVKLDVAYMIEKIIQLNASVRQRINSDRVFVYKAQGSKETRTTGNDTSLEQVSLLRNIAKFIKEHDLKDEDGRTMKLNLSRIRKTFINGIYELSGENLLLTAQQAKHSGTSTLDYYLQAPVQTKRNLGLMGEIRVKELTCVESSIPVGHCKDTINGHKAPKNGTFCNNFLGCFRCKSFVITGDDLHKLFSFYWAVVRNRNEFGLKEWKRHLKNVLRIVDEEIMPEFVKLGQLQRVEEEKERARTNPHPYWQNLDMLKVAL